MKKFLAILMLMVLTVGVLAVPVSAATPKEQLVACAKENMPEELMTRYLPSIENTLRMITVNQAQADEICDLIVETREYFESTGGFKGVSLHSYSRAQQDFALDMVARMCEVLGLTARYTISTSPEHDFDFVCTIYDQNGKRIAVLDGDAVKQTNAPYTVNYTYVVGAVALLLAAAVAAVMGKKFAAER